MVATARGVWNSQIVSWPTPWPYYDDVLTSQHLISKHTGVSVTFSQVTAEKAAVPGKGP